MSTPQSAFRIRSAVLCSGFVVILVLAGSAADFLAAQSRVPTPDGRPSSAAKGVANPTAFSAAIASNKIASNELKWSFGGKAQQGWAIYIPLIVETVRAGKGAESAEFAEAVARWQGNRGLRVTGVLDIDTWSAMIREFQSHRIKDSITPPSENLIVAPASEFYDPERPPELRQVEKNTYAAYKRMLAEAAKDRSLGLSVTTSGELAPAEKYLKIVSAYRSREHQDRLRQAEPQAGSAGLAVNSPHFTGRALDLYVGGEPVSTADGNRLFQTRTAVYAWLVKNAGRFGFRPYFYEPWHWEYVTGATIPPVRKE
ncbi:MAG TPA: M15 family metallopeptidase [Blastocatellia bacterium]|nr:M15 family metallopeptidase [Blastocatellia bacterium]